MTCEVKVIEDSINPNNEIRVTTLELRYWRAIHSEFMTHRVFSRNASSSRAIPVKTMIKQVWNNPAMPVYWGKNQAGMKARTELSSFKIALSKFVWVSASKVACIFAYLLTYIGLHKQVSNRLIEPWQYISVIATSTEWDNFFGLRDHPDAQPEIRELAIAMKKAMDQSKPEYRELHLPYISDKERETIKDISVLKQISTARCARVSYLTHDGKNPSIDRDIKLHNDLIVSRPIHASPLEHQLTANTSKDFVRNVRGWTQYRVELEQEIYNQEKN